MDETGGVSVDKVLEFFINYTKADKLLASNFGLDNLPTNLQITSNINLTTEWTLIKEGTVEFFAYDYRGYDHNPYHFEGEFSNSAIIYKKPIRSNCSSYVLVTLDHGDCGFEVLESYIIKSEHQIIKGVNQYTK